MPVSRLLAMRNYLQQEIKTHAESISASQRKIQEYKYQLARCNEILKEKHVTL